MHWSKKLIISSSWRFYFVWIWIRRHKWSPSTVFYIPMTLQTFKKQTLFEEFKKNNKANLDKFSSSLSSTSKRKTPETITQTPQFVLSNSSIWVRQILHRYAKTTRCSPAGLGTRYLIFKTEVFTCINFQQLIRRWYCDCDRLMKESLRILRQCSKGQLDERAMVMMNYVFDMKERKADRKWRFKENK